MGSCFSASAAQRQDLSEEDPIGLSQHSKLVFECCLSSPNYVDEQLFGCWARGQSAMAAYNSGPATATLDGLDEQLHVSWVQDQWQLFSGLEHYLQHPWLLKEQAASPRSLG